MPFREELILRITLVLGLRPGELFALHWDDVMGEFLLDWEDIRSEADPHGLAIEFAHSAFQHACTVCEWDPVLAESAAGSPPPIH